MQSQCVGRWRMACAHCAICAVDTTLSYFARFGRESRQTERKREFNADGSQKKKACSEESGSEEAGAPDSEAQNRSQAQIAHQVWAAV
jgi:hypothetical protein